MNRKVLIGIGLIAGVAQAFAGMTMYLMGVYFAPWSMLVSVFLLLVCIAVGTGWYRAHYLSGEMSYWQALTVGIVISVCTGVVYAIYNMVSIRWLYPHFLDELVRVRLASGGQQQNTESFAALRAEVSASGIAIGNLIRLSVFGSLLSLISSLFLRRRREGT